MLGTSTPGSAQAESRLTSSIPGRLPYSVIACIDEDISSLPNTRLFVNVYVFLLRSPFFCVPFVYLVKADLACCLHMMCNLEEVRGLRKPSGKYLY